MNSINPKISIIIPAFNEEGAIGDTIYTIHELGLPEYEVIVVDDGSTDRTAIVAEEAGARVIKHPYNIGNGASVKTGIRCAKGAVFIFMDGDGQHNPRDIPRLIENIDRYHMIVGARGKASQTHLHRNLANKFYNSFASLIAGFRIQDLTSGFRAMRKQDALRFCDMFPNKFSYPTTSTLAFIRTGRSIAYVPIQTRFRIGKSKIKIIRDGLQFLMIIVKIAMSFSPLRVFLPISLALFSLGLGRYLHTYLSYGRFTNMSHLLINSSVIIFMLGLIAEQIASLRLERGDKLFEVEDSSVYSSVKEALPHAEQVPDYDRH